MVGDGMLVWFAAHHADVKRVAQSWDFWTQKLNIHILTSCANQLVSSSHVASLSRPQTIPHIQLPSGFDCVDARDPPKLKSNNV